MGKGVRTQNKAEVYQPMCYVDPEQGQALCDFEQLGQWQSYTLLGQEECLEEASPELVTPLITVLSEETALLGDLPPIYQQEQLISEVLGERYVVGEHVCPMPLTAETEREEAPSTTQASSSASSEWESYTQPLQALSQEDRYWVVQEQVLSFESSLQGFVYLDHLLDQKMLTEDQWNELYVNLENPNCGRDSDLTGVQDVEGGCDTGPDF